MGCKDVGTGLAFSIDSLQQKGEGMEHPEPLNYTSKAIEAIAHFGGMLASAHHQDYSPSEEILGFLRRAVTFVLPQPNNLIDPASLQRAIDGVDVPRLPFPICSFESHYKDLHLDGQFNMAFHKRISLCLEYDDLPPGSLLNAVNKYSTLPPEGGIVAISITALPKGMVANDPFSGEPWSVFPFAGVIPRSPQSKFNPKGPGTYFQLGINHEKGATPLDAGMFLVPICPRQAAEYMLKVQSEGISDPANTAATDIFDEVLTPLAVTAILGCSNAGLKTVGQPAKLNKKRIANGKTPLPGYTYISITPPVAKTGSDHQGGSHASPRCHLRRGHIRRYPDSGKQIWVQSTLVNAGAGENGKQVYKIG